MKGDGLPLNLEGLHSRVTDLEAGLADNTLALRDLRKETKALTARIDTIDLNGQGPMLKHFLKEIAPKLESILPELLDQAHSRQDVTAFWRVLRRWSGWDKGLRVVLYLAVAAAVTAVVVNLLHGQSAGPITP
jgi:hypothetical protein